MDWGQKFNIKNYPVEETFARRKYSLSLLKLASWEETENPLEKWKKQQQEGLVVASLRFTENKIMGGRGGGEKVRNNGLSFPCLNREKNTDCI